MDSNPTTRAGPRDVLRRGHGGGSVVGPVAWRRMARIDARADHVGSLLRPPALLEARAASAAGRLDAVAFKAGEDAPIREGVGLPGGAGCPGGTDGELRPEAFQARLGGGTNGGRGGGPRARV